MQGYFVFGTAGPLAALLLTGCIGQSASQTKASGEEGPSAEEVAQANPNLKVCKTKPADDGLLDDFEDENTQLLTIAGRDGYWWKHKDEFGSKFDPDELTIVDHVEGDGFKAIYATGETAAGQDAYGVLVGVNFASSGLYDATKYVGISFKAKVDDGAQKKVRFKVADVNTHADAGVCTSCWNHFGKDLTLTSEWQEYVVLFAELKQAPHWGDPRPPAVDTEKLMALDWSIGPSGKFGLWLDDVQFLVCE